MAVFRPETTPSTEHAALVREFQDELARNRAVGQPYVLVNDVGQTRTYHVTAVWDRWARLKPAQRSRVIIDAMNRHDPETVGRITIAMGLTGAEAKRMGVLPYAIQLLAKSNEQDLRRRGIDLLERHGAFQTDDGPELLFRSEDAAIEEYSRLKEEGPGLPWALYHAETAARD